MKLTRSKLIQLIKEELKAVLDETPVPSQESIVDCVDAQCAAQVAVAVLSGQSIEEVLQIPCVRDAKACIDGQALRQYEGTDPAKDKKSALEKITGQSKEETKKSLEKIKDIGKKKSKKGK